MVEKDWEHDFYWYQKPDLEWGAAVRLEGQKGLTVAGENLKGDRYKGFGLLLSNCSDITINNCQIQNFYYGIYAINCQNIKILDCDLKFNFNKRNVGWIIAKDPKYNGDFFGFGGGVYFRDVLGGSIYHNQLGDQFNGIDLISSQDVEILENNIVNVSNYGVHLWNSSLNFIKGNDLRYAIRFTPQFKKDTADSVGVLIEENSNRNMVWDNDLRYCGDGLYIRDLTAGRAPSNYNMIIKNDGSHSPNNAFEVVYSQGNVLMGNQASHSNFGMWLDYSQDLILASNIVEQNETEGIHIKGGSFKSFYNNRILKNPSALKIIGRFSA